MTLAWRCLKTAYPPSFWRRSGSTGERHTRNFPTVIRCQLARWRQSEAASASSSSVIGRKLTLRGNQALGHLRLRPERHLSAAVNQEDIHLSAAVNQEDIKSCQKTPLSSRAARALSVSTSSSTSRSWAGARYCPASTQIQADVSAKISRPSCGR